MPDGVVFSVDVEDMEESFTVLDLANELIGPELVGFRGDRLAYPGQVSFVERIIALIFDI